MKLIKLSKSGQYKLVDEQAREQVSGTIEHISLIMEGKGIVDEEIDLALKYMVNLGHTAAVFGDLYGAFMYTEAA